MLIRTVVLWLQQRTWNFGFIIALLVIFCFVLFGQLWVGTNSCRISRRFSNHFQSWKATTFWRSFFLLFLLFRTSVHLFSTQAAKKVDFSNILCWAEEWQFWSHRVENHIFMSGSFSYCWFSIEFGLWQTHWTVLADLFLLDLDFKFWSSEWELSCTDIVFGDPGYRVSAAKVDNGCLTFAVYSLRG